MSRRLARLLDEPEQTVADLVAELESKNRHPSHDVRHIAENHQRLRKVLADLSLDPDDTTAEELFHALRTKFEVDIENIDGQFAAADKSFDERMTMAIGLMQAQLNMPKLWVLKKSAAKELIRQHAPKQVMKFLRYRSVQSLLKHEDILTVYLVAQELESAAWLKSHDRLISKLDAAAFELREVSLVHLDLEKWVDAGSDQLGISSEHMGAVSIMPGRNVEDLSILSIILLLSDGLGYYGADTKQLYGINDRIGWWAGTDDLIADLKGGQVALNIHDVAASWLLGHSFEERQIHHSRQNFWQSLLNRYENREEHESLFDNSIIQRVRKLNINAPEPAFEYDFAEDF